MSLGESYKTLGLRLRSRNWSVLTVLFLMLTLTACESAPEVITKIEYRDRPVPTPVKVPAGLLVPCTVSPTPVVGDTWQDVWMIMVAKDREQATCNERFNQIRDWQEGAVDGQGESERHADEGR